MQSDLTASAFEGRLLALQSDEELKKHQRYFKIDIDDQPIDNYFIGVRMGSIFALGKEFSEMTVGKIEKLLESPIHEMRTGAMSIMGQAAKANKCSGERLSELYNLYILRHDRINDWDLVDLAAYYVIGKYLADQPREILYKLARSKNLWKRRTSIVATAHFILKLKQTRDTFKIAEILVNDPEDLVNKGTGWMLRSAGEVDRAALLAFLDRYAATMPRVLLRYSIEKLDKQQRDYYLKLKKV